MAREVIIVVFGAKVLLGGEPSGSLKRRIAGAISCAKQHDNVIFIGTGAIGDHSPSEAFVISQQLQKVGVHKKYIIEEDISKDTIDSIFNCTQIIQNYPERMEVLVCSDRYHVFRCSILFKINGIANKACWIKSGRSENGYIKWMYMWVRDFIALFYDVGIMLFSTRRGNA